MLMLSYFTDILLWVNYYILNNRVCVCLQVVSCNCTTITCIVTAKSINLYSIHIILISFSDSYSDIHPPLQSVDTVVVHAVQYSLFRTRCCYFGHLQPAYWSFSAKLLQFSKSVFSTLMWSYFADILLRVNYYMLNCNRVCVYLQVVTVLPLCAL